MKDENSQYRRSDCQWSPTPVRTPSYTVTTDATSIVAQTESCLGRTYSFVFLHILPNTDFVWFPLTALTGSL